MPICRECFAALQQQVPSYAEGGVTWEDLGARPGAEPDDGLAEPPVEFRRQLPMIDEGELVVADEIAPRRLPPIPPLDAAAPPLEFRRRLPKIDVGESDPRTEIAPRRLPPETPRLE